MRKTLQASMNFCLHLSFQAWASAKSWTPARSSRLASFHSIGSPRWGRSLGQAFVTLCGSKNQFNNWERSHTTDRLPTPAWWRHATLFLANADAFTAAKNKDCGGARPSRQNYDRLMRSACSLCCSSDNNNMDCCTLAVLFPNLKSNSDCENEY